MNVTLTAGPAPTTLPGPLPHGLTPRPRAAVWEYKVAVAPDGADCTSAQSQEELLGPLRKNGWIFISVGAGIFYLKRPKGRRLRT